MAEVTIRVRGHRGEPLIITPADRCEHVLDALFDDTRLEGGLRRIELTTETITLTFAPSCGVEITKIVRDRLPDLLGRPRWLVGDPQV
jgi:hypothetical protein